MGKNLRKEKNKEKRREKVYVAGGVEKMERETAKYRNGVKRSLSLR